MVCLSSGDVNFTFDPQTLEFTAELAPVPDDITVTLVYTSKDVEKDVYKYVLTTAEPFSGKLLTPVNVDSDNYSFTCIPSVGVNFEPADGYMITNLSSNIANKDAQNLFLGKYQGSITILPGAPAAVTVTIEIAAEGETPDQPGTDEPGTDEPGTDEPGTDDPEGPTGAVNTIGADNNVDVIYNLQGVKVDGNNLKSGIYIINGKKVVIK